MKEYRGLSSSEQYIKKSNRRLLYGGLFLLVVFLVALAFVSDKRSSRTGDDVIPVGQDTIAQTESVGSMEVTPFSRGNAELDVVPSQIDMNNVVIGSQVEAIVKLTAKNTPIIFLGASFDQEQQDGFSLETTCKENESIAVDSSCLIKILWYPSSLLQRQNNMSIKWKEDSQTSFNTFTTNVPVKAQSTDSKDCVICETVSKDDLKAEQKYAMGVNGELIPVNEDNSIVINGEVIKPTEDGLYINAAGEIVAVVTPDKIPLDMKNEIMGKIAPNGDVISPDGEKLGRLLGDDTIVDTNLKVLGAAVPVVSVMNMDGHIIGKMRNDGSIVNAQGAIIGKPLVNGSVAGLNNEVVGVLRPWGLIADFNGKVIGAVIPDGTILDGTQTVIGSVKPNGLAVNTTNDLIGGTIPQGVAVAPGCQTAGKVLQNGEVKDAYEQTIGRVLIDGTVVSPEGIDIGGVVPYGLVINEKGDILGFVNSEGKAVGPNGNVIGCINPDGSVSAGKKSVGAVMQKGRVIGYGCKQIGSVFPNGEAVSDELIPVGKVVSDGYVKNDDNKIIGVVIPRASAIADGCRILGLISINGNIVDISDQVMGCMTPERTVVNNEGKIIGALAIKGVVTNNEGEPIGRIRLDGKVMDFKGNVIGCVQEDGSVISLSGDLIGKLEQKPVAYDKNGNPTDWVIRGNKVYDKNGNLIGTIDENGIIRDKDGNIIGYTSVAKNPNAILDKNGNPTNWTIKDGKVYDENGNLIGTVDENGIIRDKNGNVIGFAPDKARAGVVLDKNGNPTNWTIKNGKVYDENGNLIGTVDKNGVIRDKNGNVIGYASKAVAGKEIGHVVNGSPSGLHNGVVLDANGNTTGWSIVGNKVYDANGNLIGNVDGDGIIAAASNGKFLGIIPPDGVIVSPEGLILGRYNSKTGYGVNEKGERFAKILPDLTVLNGDSNEIIGTLIPNNTGFMDLNYQPLATMGIDGTLKNKNGEIIGAICANGTVINKDKKVIGYQVPMGKVLSVLGKEIGSVLSTGEVTSSKKTKIGKVLPNGIVISSSGQLLGGVFKRLSVAYGPEELIGYPNITGAILDKNGNITAQATPFGLAINKDGVVGRMLPFATYVDMQNKLVGWTSFDVDLTGITGTSIGRLTSNGLALDKAGEQIGYIAKKGVTVNKSGRYFGYMSIDNTIQVQGQRGSLYASDYIYNSMEEALARILPVGIGVDNTGKFVGYLLADGTIGTEKGSFGFVLNDNRIINTKGEIKGTFIPLNSVAYTNDGQTTWLVNEKGEVITPKGQIKGHVIAPQTVIQEGEMVARLAEADLFVADNVKAKTNSIATVSGATLQIGNQKPSGNLMLNSLGINLTKQVHGSALTFGASVSNGLTAIGREILNGVVLLRGKKEAASAGTRVLFDEKDSIRGMILPIGTFVGKTGLLLGQSAVSSQVINQDGKNIATQMPLGFALSPENHWAGGRAPSGMAVDDYAQTIGTVAADGAVIDKSGEMAGRALSDGSVVDIQDRELYNTMPYKGGIVAQGLPFSYRNQVLGRTTVSGDIIDASDSKTLRILDDGTILGKDEPLAGAVLPFYTAISQNGEFMGTLDNSGQIVTPALESKGKIAVNGAVKQGKLKITGALLPQGLITDDCKVIGQATFNGQVVDAKGTIMGRILPDKWVLSPAGTKIGRVTRNGIVMSKDGTYLGRTLPDSTVVDPSGVNIGCSRNDGSVVDHATGEVIGQTHERGLVLDENGKPRARIDARGNAIDVTGKKIGVLTSEGTVINPETGEVIGHMVSRDEELIFNDKGEIAGTFSTGGEYRDPKTGEHVFTVNPETGTIVDPAGNPIGQVDENGNPTALDGTPLAGGELTLLTDKDGNTIGIVSGCDIVNPQNEKIGSISADGTVIDLNGNVIYTILGNGVILKDGEEFGRVTGTEVRLDKCGIKTLTDEEVENLKKGIDPSTGRAISLGGGASGRGIVIGGQAYKIGEEGEIIDDEGMVIGYMENGKPYTVDHRLITASGDSQGRIRPNIIDKKIKPSPEQIQQMQAILSQKRESMRAGIQSKGLITPNKRIQAMARKKADANWDSIGINKIVSSYPVDMSRMILKDKAIPAVLTRSIDSRYSSMPATAIVERHIYSEKGRNIIIPAGSRLIGTFSGEQGSDKRVAKLEITWQRLIRPDGSAFSFEATSGDAQGRGGIAAYLDDQLVQKFGKPIMTSVVTSAISYMMATNDDMYQDMNGNRIVSSKTEAANDARENFISSMQTIFDQLVQDATNIPVVIFVPSGTRLTVYANEDLWLRSEEEDIEDAGEKPTEAQKPSSASWVDTRTDRANIDAEEESEDETEQADDSAKTEESSNDSGSYSEEDKYYRPVNEQEDGETDQEMPAESSAKNEEVYSGDSKKTQSIKERKVQPVLPRTGSADKLF